MADPEKEREQGGGLHRVHHGHDRHVVGERGAVGRAVDPHVHEHEAEVPRPDALENVHRSSPPPSGARRVLAAVAGSRACGRPCENGRPHACGGRDFAGVLQPAYRSKKRSAKNGASGRAAGGAARSTLVDTCHFIREPLARFFRKRRARGSRKSRARARTRPHRPKRIPSRHTPFGSHATIYQRKRKQPVWGAGTADPAALLCGQHAAGLRPTARPSQPTRRQRWKPSSTHAP